MDGTMFGYGNASYSDGNDDPTAYHPDQDVDMDEVYGVPLLPDEKLRKQLKRAKPTAEERAKVESEVESFVSELGDWEMEMGQEDQALQQMHQQKKKDKGRCVPEMHARQ
jgi:hypothetical protein